MCSPCVEERWLTRRPAWSQTESKTLSAGTTGRAHPKRSSADELFMNTQVVTSLELMDDSFVGGY